VNLSSKDLIRYGVAGALAVVVVAGAVYFLDRSPSESAPTTAQNANPPVAAPAASDSTPSAAKTAKPATAAAPTANPDEPAVPNAAQTDKMARLLGDARRLAADGKFDEAKAALDQADKVIPGSDDTAAARRDIAALSSPEGQLVTQLARARAAIAQNDTATANQALAEAEKINPQAPEIPQLRQAMQAAQQKETHRNSRVTELLTTMREAIARHDFAAADGALNEAARIDVRDPALDAARIELARAHDADRKNKVEK
jgi:tetratricopeptide (TPR) repeat protein